MARANQKEIEYLRSLESFNSNYKYFLKHQIRNKVQILSDELLLLMSQFFGKKNVVLFFYPRAEGLTCIKEAEAFRNNYEVFKESNAEVIGISA